MNEQPNSIAHTRFVSASHINRFALLMSMCFFFFFSSRRRHTRFDCDWSSDVCSSDLPRLDRDQVAATEPVIIGPVVTDRLGGGDLVAVKAGDAVFGVVYGTSDHRNEDRKSVVEGKRVDLGGGRIIKKKKSEESRENTW